MLKVLVEYCVDDRVAGGVGVGQPPGHRHPLRVHGECRGNCQDLEEEEAGRDSSARDARARTYLRVTFPATFTKLVSNAPRRKDSTSSLYASLIRNEEGNKENWNL